MRRRAAAAFADKRVSKPWSLAGETFVVPLSRMAMFVTDPTLTPSSKPGNPRTVLRGRMVDGLSVEVLWCHGEVGGCVGGRHLVQDRRCLARCGR